MSNYYYIAIRHKDLPCFKLRTNFRRLSELKAWAHSENMVVYKEPRQVPPTYSVYTKKYFKEGGYSISEKVAQYQKR